LETGIDTTYQMTTKKKKKKKKNPNRNKQSINQLLLRRHTFDECTVLCFAATSEKLVENSLSYTIPAWLTKSISQKRKRREKRTNVKKEKRQHGPQSE
jgi:hypothetical protein